MRVLEIMTKSVVTVEMDDSLKVIKDIFDNVFFHHLLVVEYGRLFGVISDRDLLKAISPNIGTVRETAADLATLNKKAHQIMTRQPFTLAPAAGVDEAIKIFISHDVSCIPIVDEEHSPVGIVSWRDLLKIMSDPNWRPF